MIIIIIVVIIIIIIIIKISKLNINFQCEKKTFSILTIRRSVAAECYMYVEEKDS